MEDIEDVVEDREEIIEEVGSEDVVEEEADVEGEEGGADEQSKDDYEKIIKRAWQLAHGIEQRTPSLGLLLIR